MSRMQARALPMHEGCPKSKRRCGRAGRTGVGRRSQVARTDKTLSKAWHVCGGALSEAAGVGRKKRHETCGARKDIGFRVMWNSSEIDVIGCTLLSALWRKRRHLILYLRLVELLLLARFHASNAL